MKKAILLAMVGVMGASSANAGWLSNLFGQKSAEPKTLEEACNKDEITAFCPEIILGTQTIQECLMNNVTKLSTKCANFVKKSATEKVDAVKNQVASVRNSVQTANEEQKAEIVSAKQAAKDAKAEMKASKEEFKTSLKETKKAVKEAAAAEKAAWTEGWVGTAPAE